MGIRKIGILTSGGDCAGLNAVVRAATDAAVGRGWEVLGLRNGHLGLMVTPPDVVELTVDAVRGDVLRAWEVDARLMSVAEEENMSDGERRKSVRSG